MNHRPERHLWLVPTQHEGRADGQTFVPEPDLDLRSHRRLHGPYTAGGALLNHVVPEMVREHGELVAARATEVVSLAPGLTPLVPAPLRTLTSLANRAERTRFYPTARTLHVAHGVAELLTEWARALHPDGVTIAFRELEDADPTDRELVSVLLRRCDPSLVTILVEGDAGADDELSVALARYAQQVPQPPVAEPALPAEADLAQLFIDSDGTSKDPRLERAYAELSPEERASRHAARAEHLVSLGEPGWDLGAIPYHLENSDGPLEAVGEVFVTAAETCFDRGFYEAALDLALRGRAPFGEDRTRLYWNLTSKIGACLSYLKRAPEGFPYFDELRRWSINPEAHMNSCYMMAMLYTRHLPKGMHDEYRALEWVNTAIAIADLNPDPHRRIFTGAFMRNARALVEMHRGNLDGSLALVNEAIAMTDADLGPDEQLLHRSVLLYNRAQILAAQADFEGSLRDYDEVIRRDPDYGDYYFERAACRRKAGRYEDALADYATCIRLSPPFYEVHFNRADLLRELGDDEAALRDLDYALLLEPTHVDSLVNRADLLLALGELDRAGADIAEGLGLDTTNAHLLSAQAALQAESGDPEAAHASYTAALEQDPSLVAAWANRAVLAYSAGRCADAVSDLDRAIELEDDVALRINRAIALQDLGDHERSLVDLDIAVAAFADEDPDLLYRRGASRHALHDVEGAIADWRQHLAAYGPDQTSPYLAQIQLLSGGLGEPVEVR
jgi:tetratricopeptide (TPR) repeat protein